MKDLTQHQLIRMLSEMIQFGVIVDVQAKPLRYKVKFNEHLTSDWLRSNVGHAGKVKDWHPLQKGEQVVVLKQFGMHGGFIAASLNQNSFDQPKDNLNLFYREFPDGTWLEYDMEDHKLSGKVTGTVDLNVAAEFRVESPKIVLVGDIEHDGKQATTGDISSGANITAANNISDSVRSMAGDREIYNGHDHNHGDPKTSKANQSQ
ncbi:phage baseplate assembly protein V [Photobacterium sp. OFAV2-7]|uniref:phage baseplate assembly protein V n=1 Tax=Photobacterium sp. OFAV2-7 TaxID=2917748 RepID=UPI001EF3F252|nr:phage baseplate assembly protein V [Photobacterium sp. OFAV2-7]MCG7585443.1 phage baseplate assembly protein V [Photobacterium sp. OFAV2-7]